jgi:hypothetical protein
VCGIWDGSSLKAVEYGRNDCLDAEHPLHRALLQQHVRALLSSGRSTAAASLLRSQPGVQGAVALFLAAVGHEAAQVLTPSSLIPPLVQAACRQFVRHDMRAC